MFELPIISGNKETTILFVLAVFLFVVSLVLLILERGVKRKIKEIGLNRTFFYAKQIKDIKNHAPEQDQKQLLVLVNSIAKSFFRDYLGLQREATYEELAEEFRRRGDSNKADMCDELSKIVYSEENVNRDSIVEILEQLEKIITEEGVISEQTKKIKGTSRINAKKIKIILKDANKSLEKNDLEKAQQAYISITRLYKTINAKNKVKFQPKILNLYKRISNV